ncbi:IS3 family transposase [Lachnospiraceae bacterium]|nr:IS3 family transposase [uncultured Schaedlerella sp.]NBI61142.1 IS3 family transposase [Lachnospiraceae bacterium]
MTEALFLETARYEEQLLEEGKRRPNVSGVLRLLGVSRSGYLAWKKRLPSNREKRKEQIKEQIKERIIKIYQESHQNYGAPKIAECLRREGAKIADKTVGDYMRELGIKAQYVKPYTVTTIEPDQSSRLRNILKEKFNPEEPDAVWCSDITYVWTYEGFVYLTSIMDLYSRKIISWVLSNTLEAKYVVKAVEKAKRRRGVEKPLILHTDRGIQYVCREYVEATAGMKRSYSKKAYPWDNACIESFHALIKREWLNRFKIKNYDHAYKLVFEYIETFYNTVRIHSHCGYLSPNEYENEYEQKLNKMERLAG